MNQSIKKNLTHLLEDTIVIIVMFGVFLPVRLLFVEYISDVWIGSFGLITAIVISMVILSKKNKLGYFGRIYWKSISRIHKGKRRIISYCMIGFSLYLWGSIIFGVQYAQDNQEVLELRVDVEKSITPQEQQKLDQLTNAIESKNIQKTHDSLMESYQEIPIELLLLGAVMIVLMPVLDVTVWAVLVSMLDGFMAGWLVHFGTVFFIEALEVVGIMIYTYTQTRKTDKEAN